MIFTVIFLSPLNCSKGEQWSQLRYAVNKQLLQHSVMNLTDTLHSVSEDLVTAVKKSRESPTMQLNDQLLYNYLTKWAFEGEGNEVFIINVRDYCFCKLHCWKSYV